MGDGASGENMEERERGKGKKEIERGGVREREGREERERQRERGDQPLGTWQKSLSTCETVLYL